MSFFSTEITIDRPADQVFDLLSDPERFEEWNPGITTFEVIEGDGRTVGSRFRETRRVGRRTGSVMTQLEQYEPPRQYATSSAGRGVTGIYTFTLTPGEDDESTHVRLDADVEVEGIAGRFAAISLRAVLRRDAKAMLPRLKDAAEQPD